MGNFKFYSPMQKLNAGLFGTKVFEEGTKINMFGGRRYHRFIACQEAFRHNLSGLNIALSRIGEHYQLTYKKEDRLGVEKHKYIRNTFQLSIDLETYFIKMKTLLDCMAFFTPFYYTEPLLIQKQDVRDFGSPCAFRTVRKYFISNKIKDKGFHNILINNLWIDDILWKRDILCHKFHRMSINHDCWTKSYYVYMYEFNKIREFIPDVLFYVSNTYFKMIRFLDAIEKHFKEKCEKNILGYKYYYQGDSFGNKMDKVHYYFASLGKMLEGKILIRINPGLRSNIRPCLIKILNSLNIRCKKCNKITFNIRSTIEHYVLISAHCKCGEKIYLGDSVAKRFYPYFYDQNQNYWDLIPEYKLEEKITY